VGDCWWCGAITQEQWWRCQEGGPRLLDCVGAQVVIIDCIISNSDAILCHYQSHAKPVLGGDDEGGGDSEQANAGQWAGWKGSRPLA